MNLLQREDGRSHGVYLGPDAYNSISALNQTVQEEIEMHGVGAARPNPFLQEWQISHLAERNPFTLSGGEQVLVAVAAKLNSEPEFLAIDCTLEQLDQDWKDLILEYLHKSGVAAWIADNRWHETLAPVPFSTVEMPQQPASIDLRQLHSISHCQELQITPKSTGWLTCRELTFQYPAGKQILEKASFEFEPGKIYALRAKNGSGKSTFARLLAGILQPDDGSILFDGDKIHPYINPGKTVAYHFQNPDAQLFCQTVREEILAGAAVTLNDYRFAENLAHLFGLEEVLACHPMDLPFAGRKRLAMAATLAMRCPWMILDEPTLGQDSRSADALACILKQLASFGAGIIIISHSTKFLSSLNPKYLSIQNSKIHPASIGTNVVGNNTMDTRTKSDGSPPTG